MTAYLGKILILGGFVVTAEMLAWPPLAVGALVALGWVFAKTRRLFVVLEAAASLINRELQNTQDGDSLKDDVAALLNVQHIHSQRLAALEERSA